MTVRNRKSFRDAMVLRGFIAAILSQHSPFQAPLTDAAIRDRLDGAVSLKTIQRHRAWLRRLDRQGKLQEALVQWIKLAREGRPPDPEMGVQR
jgi:hypothetical protein